MATAFTRGEQRVEMISLDRTTTRYNFYLLEFTQACNAEPGGCTFGDRFTPAIESDWLELSVRDDEELKNTRMTAGGVTVAGRTIPRSRPC